VKKALLFGISLSLMFFTNSIAFVLTSDRVLDENENAIYMIGWVYSRIVSHQREPNDDGQIYRINLSNNTKEIYYELPGAKLDRLLLSPDSKYIAVLKGHSGWLGQLSELLIINTKDKKDVLSFKDEIGLYKWSPDGKKIVYITGGAVESRGFLSTGVWVYDLDKKEKVKIADKANDVEWLPSGDIYIIAYERKSEKKRKSELIYNSSIYSYKDRATIYEGLKGVKFSLDGNYSILLTLQYGNITADEHSIRINFYDVKTEKVILPDKLTNIFSEPSRIVWDSFSWVKGNRVVFEKSIINSLKRDILICDIESNNVLKTLKGIVVGVNSDRSKVVVFNEGKFEAVTVP
jgi:dipeptidyl aminopeptidase/acylaminoacyl peptidase